MSNADRLKNMTEEELAIFLQKLIDNGTQTFDKETCQACEFNVNGECVYGDEDDLCFYKNETEVELITRWLKLDTI